VLNKNIRSKIGLLSRDQVPKLRYMFMRNKPQKLILDYVTKIVYFLNGFVVFMLT
jgi:hypothetical protein